MRRLGLLVAVGAFWLILAAAPALADGGPHVMTVNNGSLGLTADSCAGCHRAHTAQGPNLINAEDDTALCLTCHGATGAGATTDVASGLQYRLAGRGTTPLLGALRSGGFVRAALDSTNPARVFRVAGIGGADDQWAKVPVRTDSLGAVEPAPVTSAHLNLAENGLSAPGVAWGNGEIGLGFSGPGPIVTMGCMSCHNPHGNGQYRILNPIPAPDGDGFVEALSPALVTDSAVDNPNPAESDTKNYTVIQTKGTGTPPAYLLYADDVSDTPYGPTSGDYWHVRVPWNSASGASDAPNGRPTDGIGGIVAFNTQITSWCTACHTRYFEVSGNRPRGDAIYTYRHQTTEELACTTCHVAHGSNARMPGTYSLTQPFPGGIAAPTYNINGTTGDSRLLKVDNRGTCQMCHDPTGTVLPGTYTGPSATPGVP